MGRPTLLCPEIQEVVIDYINRGAFDWVAAQAAGIHPSTFYNWMRLGKSVRSQYHEFYLAVTKARAQARINAEIQVAQMDPFKWLRYGPGRERPGEPGWSDATEISGPGGGPIRIVRVGGIDPDEDI